MKSIQDITIREGNKNDKSEILRLYELFGDYFVAIDDLKMVIKTADYAAQMHAELIANVTSKPGKVYVAEQDGKLVGFIAGNITEINSVESIPHRKGRILDLFIIKELRGQGLGKQLIAKLEEYFQSNDCDVINVEVFAPNKSAYNFYAKYGYVDRNHDMIKLINKLPVSP